MLLNQGLELLVYGMGTVVVFLTLLVFATRLMSGAVLRYFPEPELPVPASRDSRNTGGGQSPAVLAAISAALHVHRRRRDSH